MPPIVTSAFKIIPHLLAAICLIQNRLLGMYYTALHQYCEDNDFPSPPPPMEDVIAKWAANYKPAQKEFESVGCIARGRAIYQALHIADDPGAHNRKSPVSPMASDGRRSVSGLISSGSNGTNDGPGPMPPRPNRIASTSSIPSQAASIDPPSPQAGLRNPSFSKPSYTASNSSLLAPTDFTTASNMYGSSPVPSPNSLRSRTDYFSNASARPSTASTAASSTSPSLSKAVSPGGGPGGGLAVKKKPPPPPPKRRAMAAEEFVVAQFAFSGQGAGDLSFSEGDRIRIVKKTDTDQDWWVGELAGVKGSFPANYCKAA